MNSSLGYLMLGIHLAIMPLKPMLRLLFQLTLIEQQQLYCSPSGE
jgi:hypothetical protein